MAEIKIEKKPTYWPWMLLVILVLAVIVYFTFFRTNEPDMEAQAVTTNIDTVNTGPISTVSAYVNFINSDTNSMGLDHTYASQALTQLTEATKAMADKEGVDINDNIGQAKELADKITVDPTEITHANSIKKAADMLSVALGKIQEAKFPQLKQEATSVVEAANAIDPDVLTLDQKDAVKTFFNRSASLLQNMNR